MMNLNISGKIILLFSICFFVNSAFLKANVKGFDWNIVLSEYDLVYSDLPTVWDEGIPLGNAIIGALVWEKEKTLRFSLDRIDLWDLRPTDGLFGDNFRFEWIKEHIRNGNYAPVQEKFDKPYANNPAPSKIPGAALEFPLDQLGKPVEIRLCLNNALCEIRWAGKQVLRTFIHASKPVGWFVFENLEKDIEPSLIPPDYQKNVGLDDNSHAGADLERLGYRQGKIIKTGNKILYQQNGWNGFCYEVAVEWVKRGNSLYGVWSITSTLVHQYASTEVASSLKQGFAKGYKEHLDYWKKFWSQSSICLPDTLLQKQYQNEMYKLGSVARENSYPISLQAVWTADNGKLPPWKGDYHHDLNTELSYWPVYTSNHLEEGLGYLNTIWNQMPVYREYTKSFFETSGINIPGVATLTGEPMGGWCQYAMSQTVSAWIAYHFYLHWKYSADRTFLEDRAYPFIKEVAVYLDQMLEKDEKGFRRLEFSSSPEIFDNSLKAWFTNMTNYDLALVKCLFTIASELADELNLQQDYKRWKQICSELPDLDVDEQYSLTFAPGIPYAQSHRHFSHAMAIYPLGIIDVTDGNHARKIISSTIEKLDEYGSDYWTGYSFSWLGNLKARAGDGDGAVEALRTFARCFCLKNTFHANGDQSKTGKSKFTYRPFTLEGNFAFASGILEMLLQSHTGVIRLFPAIPTEWEKVSFNKLRAQGGFLVSASMVHGELDKVKIFSERGGIFRLAVPQTFITSKPFVRISDDVIEIRTEVGESIDLAFRQN